MAKRKITAHNSTDGGKQRRSAGIRVLRFVSILLTILLGVVLIVSAYSGRISPLRYGGIWGLLQLSYPLWLTVMVFVVFIQLFYCRKGAFIGFAAMLFTAGPFLDFCPLNFSSRKPLPDAPVIKVMSYNAMGFFNKNYDVENQPEENLTLKYIIDSDADIVCVEEATFLFANKRFGVTHQLLDSLHSVYPYVYKNGDYQAFFSRYPAEPIHLDVNYKELEGYISAYRVTVDDRLLTVFSLHLRSFALDQSDKNAYRDLTELQPDGKRSAIGTMLRKITEANVSRARQAVKLLSFIRLYGGPDVIVCGDFNDCPDCYAIHRLNDAGFRSVYPEVGLGPMITYNSDRFYFCIDHILTRGGIRPLSIRKDRVRYSDHYPLIATLELMPTNKEGTWE